MKKHKLLFLGAALAAIPFVASAQADTPFDPSVYEGRTHKMDRHLKNFTLKNADGSSLPEKQYNVNQTEGEVTKNIYFDLFNGATDADIFVTNPGATVHVSQIAIKTNWMHAYLYIDWNGDGFNSYLNKYPTESGLPASFAALQAPAGTYGDLMSFTKYNFGTETDQNWRNSLGKATTHTGVGVPAATTDTDINSAIPQFTIPDYADGEYKALLKIDYNDITQHSEHKNGKDELESTGGCVVLFKIKVVALSTSTRTITIESNNEAYGTVAFQGAGITGKKHEFKASEAAVVVATANPGYAFLNWTKDGEVVSTDAEYTVDIYDEVFTLTANFVSEEEKPDDTFDWNRYNQVYSSSASGSNRALTSFTLSDGTQSQKFEINQVYSAGVSIRFDKRAVVFNTTTGSTVDFSEFKYNGAWRDACLFINYNGDDGFNSRLNNTGLNLSEEASSYLNVLNPSPRGELVAFSSHEFADGVFYNSQGSTTDKNGKALNTHFAVSPCLSDANMPSFTIPDWVKTGDYMALLKIAWGDLDQHPVATKTEDLISWGGCAVLFTIHVENTTPRVEWPTEGEALIATSYNDAAHVTINYQPQNLDNDSHYIQAYAVHQANSVESAPAYRTMARAAAGEADEHGDCIYPDNFDQTDNDNETLVFTLPVNATTATLHFAPNMDGYEATSSHTYSVTVKTFSKENGALLNETDSQRISFVTDGDTSGIVDIEEAATAAPRYYNLQGIEVAQPTSAGIYIVRQGNAVSKVYVK